MSKELDKDNILKEKMRQYLWYHGYITRKNIKITDLWETTSEYTDIDVVGIKIDEELNPNFVVCDCKSGIRQGTPERLFWLVGLIRYFGTNNGYFIRSQVFNPKYFELANKLNITILSSDALDNLLLSYSQNINNLQKDFFSYSEKTNKIFDLYKKYNHNAYHYLINSYWFDYPREQIATVISISDKLIKDNPFDEKIKSFLLAYNILLLSLSILRFTKEILILSPPFRQKAIELNIDGGKMKAEETKKLFSHFYHFLINEIKERYKQYYPISEVDFIKLLTPSRVTYSKYLIDLILRLCNYPSYAVLAPKFFELFANQVILNEQEFELKDIIPCSKDADSFAKPILDIFTFAKRCNITSKELEDKFSKINKFK